MPLQLPAMPNFNVNVPDFTGEALKAAQLRSVIQEMSQRQQLAPFQAQEAQQKAAQAGIQTQTQQMELDSRQAMFRALSDPDFTKQFMGTPQADSTGLGFDPNALGQALFAKGVKDPNVINGFVNELITRSKSIADIYKAEAETSASRVTAHTNANKLLANKIGSILDMPAQKAVGALTALKEDIRDNPKAYEGVPQNDLLHIVMADLEHLPAMASMIGLDSQLADYHKGQSEAATAAQKVINPKTGLSPEQTSELTKEKAEQPLKLQLTREEQYARQAAMQGDPNAAGKLLASGALTLSDLKTRGMTPAFIEKVTIAAQKLNPNYNPADENIAEQIAKSPQANQFFGSANSLINKGGTLDQLERLGKNIPQGQFPILNKIDDWQKLARGQGPLAAYAATALGVADDYGKVMGGGNASDHARDAALQLFSQAASPEQRAQAVAATRDAVQSQRDSRIGNNQFLRRQYGVEPGGKSGGPPAGATHIVPGRDGKRHYTNAAGTVDLGIAP